MGLGGVLLYLEGKMCSEGQIFIIRLYSIIAKLVSRASPYHTLYIVLRTCYSRNPVRCAAARPLAVILRPDISCISKRTLLELELTVDVLNPLGEVKVTGIPVALEILQVSAKNRDIRIALNGEVNVRRGLAEALAVPLEVTYSTGKVSASMSSLTTQSAVAYRCHFQQTDPGR